MKKLTLLTVTLVLLAGLAATSCRSGKSVVKTVNAAEAAAMMSDRHITLLDVRTPAEYAAGHLPNAVNIDFLDPSFATAIAELNKKKAYLVYCKSGNRSTKAADLMKEKGFKNITNMLGGFTGWTGPVVK